MTFSATGNGGKELHEMNEQNQPNNGAPKPVEFNPLVSFFSNAFENLPTDIPAAEFIASIKGNDHKKIVEEIRERFQRALSRGVEYSRAKRTVEPQKKKLPCVSFAGVLPMRDKKATPKFTGLFQADLDLLGDRLSEIRRTLRDDPHVYALFVSPTGEGLKAIYRVPICKNAAEYKLAFAAVSARVQDLTGVEIDRLEDFTRLCFASHNPDACLNPNAVELPVDFSQPAEEIKPTPAATVKIVPSAAAESRRAIAERVLGMVEWQDEVLGDCHCPGEARHTTGEKPHECRIHLDHVPTIHCVHKSCESAVAATNQRLRSEIGKAEWTPQAAPTWTPGQCETGEKSEIPFPAIDNAAALCTDDSITLPPEIIRGVLHQGLKAVLGSNAKARKTWILLDAAISIATGTKFWKWDTQKGRVLYLNFEIPRAFIRSRIKRLCETKGIADVSNLDVWTLRGHAAPFWRLLPALLDKIKGGNYSLIIVDPIYKGLGGRDENSAGDIGELCNELERLAVQTGAAILYAAHFSKGNQAGKEAIDRISGSGVFGRDADSLIILTKHETPDAYAVDLILRNLPEQPGFVVQWQYPVMVEATELDPARLKQAGGRKPEHAPDDLLKLLAADGLTNSAFLAAAVENGISRRTFFRLKKELETGGKILLSAVSGKWMPISPKTQNECQN